MATKYSPKIVTDGLMLCLDPANSRSYSGSGTTLTDLTGNGYNGTLTNGVAFNSLDQGCISFDGYDDYIDLGSQSGDLRLSGSNGTISVWMYMEDVSSGDSWKRMVDKSNGGNGANGYTFFVHTDGTLTGNVNTSGLSSSAGAITDDEWFHVIYAWDGTVHYLYKDGSLLHSVSNTALPPSDTTNMRIGSWNHSTSREFKGRISQVCIWNRKLSAAEIQQNYNALKGRFNK